MTRRIEENTMRNTKLLTFWKSMPKEENSLCTGYEDVEAAIKPKPYSFSTGHGVKFRNSNSEHREQKRG
jgi:hypothetical protein